MDKIARIRQEIERRINILTNVYAEQMERNDEEMMNYYHGKVIALEELLSFLDTLSEEPDKSLEVAANDYCSLYYDWDNEQERKSVVATFKAGAEWQKEQDTRDMFMSDNRHFNKVYELGKKDMKEQMLKDAVEGEAEELYNDGESQCVVSVGTYFEPGDKVYVLKAEEE